ncbi:nucleotide exchange factor GrpE [Geodermatophilus sp. SYSU D01180]
MTSAPPVKAPGSLRPRLRVLLVAAVLGTALVTGALTVTVWSARDLDAADLVARGASVLAAAVGGALLAATVRGPLARASEEPADAPACGSVPSAAPRPGSAPRHPDGLVERVLEVRDLLENPALRARLDDGIRSAGFEVIAPAPGDPFDPSVHTAVSTEAAVTGTAPGTIAVVERVGLRQDEVLHRRAAVVVWEEQR